MRNTFRQVRVHPLKSAYSFDIMWVGHLQNDFDLLQGVIPLLVITWTRKSVLLNNALSFIPLNVALFASDQQFSEICLMVLL